MRVLLVRHAEAVNADLAPSDAERWLTDKGRETARRVGKWLLGEGLRFDRVFTSPLVRAVQTAEILAAATNFDQAVEVRRALGGGSTAEIASILDDTADDDLTALVGHEPSIRTVTAHLIGFDRFAPFRTGGACLVQRVGAASGSFQWMVDPKSLTKIDSLEDLGQ